MGTNSNAIQRRDLFNMYAGDRMATIMGYLSDVSVGGYTVFPFVGAFVKYKIFYKGGLKKIKISDDKIS